MGFAVLFLLIAAGAAGVAISRLTASVKWIAHTYDVQVSLGDISNAMTAAARARATFDASGEDAALQSFEAAASGIPGKLARTERLVSDNAGQRGPMMYLKNIETARLALLRAAVARRQAGLVSNAEQSEVSRQSAGLGSEADAVAAEMLANEQGLLVARRATSSALYVLVLCILVTAFIVSLALFYLYYRRLEMELLERERAEALALESQLAARQLSTRLLHLQDEERRKFSRELHDSLGQYLAAAKMSLDGLSCRHAGEELLDGARSHLEQALVEMRTISYLLHPPLLDETGLGTAARWYVEGFGKRSGIQVHSEIPQDFPRLAPDIELALFRVLQECLTNIHRHAKSDRADVLLRSLSGEVLLRVRDYGGGIAPDVLRQFRDGGANLGVGLAGMRERVRDQGGKLEIQSDSSGVIVLVTMPAVVAVAGAVAEPPELSAEMHS